MRPLLFLKQGLVLFWAVWSTLVFASNLADAFQHVGVLPTAFPFTSGNAGAVREVTQVLGTPASVAAILFAGVLGWDAVNAVLFWRAVRYAGRLRHGEYRAVTWAFVVALGLWAALMVADELFLAYRVAAFEATHRSIFVAMLVSLLAVRLLPND